MSVLTFCVAVQKHLLWLCGYDENTNDYDNRGTPPSPLLPIQGVSTSTVSAQEHVPGLVRKQYTCTQKFLRRHCYPSGLDSTLRLRGYISCKTITQNMHVHPNLQVDGARADSGNHFLQVL